MLYKVSFGDVTSEQSAVAVYMFLSALAFIGRIVLAGNQKVYSSSNTNLLKKVNNYPIELKMQDSTINQ